MWSRFGYFDFRQNFLILSRICVILPKILCRIQIWVSKIGLPLGQIFKLKKKTKNLKKCCAQNNFILFSTYVAKSYCIKLLYSILYIVIYNKYQVIIKISVLLLLLAFQMVIFMKLAYKNLFN